MEFNAGYRPHQRLARSPRPCYFIETGQRTSASKTRKHQSAVPQWNKENQSRVTNGRVSFRSSSAAWSPVLRVWQANVWERSNWPSAGKMSLSQVPLGGTASCRLEEACDKKLLRCCKNSFLLDPT